MDKQGNPGKIEGKPEGGVRSLRGSSTPAVEQGERFLLTSEVKKIVMTEDSSAPAAPHKIKVRLPYQRACNEKNDKGKLCAGHLKRWFSFGEEIRRQYGTAAEVYRCEHCHTLYLPAPVPERRTGTLQY